MKLMAYDRRRIGNKLHKLTTVLYDQIPLADVSNVLKEFNLILLQEDNTEWSGFLCGAEESTLFTLGDINTKNDAGEYTPIKNQLYFYWYKHITGRYEINMYLT